MKQLSDLLNYLQPGPYIVSSEFYDDSYETPVLTAGKTFVLGYTDDTKGIYKASENPVILFDDFTTASKWVDFDFKVKSSACKILIGKRNVDLRYVYHAMQSIQFDSSEHKRYWIKDYSQITVPYPDKQKRERVVRTLDGILGQIELAQSQIRLCEEQVKSLFNEMFAADCYKEIPLKSVANVGSSKRVFTDEFVDEGIPFYRGSEIGQLSKGQEPNNPFRITREHYAQLICDKGKPLPGDILMPSICDKGQLWIVDDREFYYKDGRVLSISPNRTRVMPRFLCDQLKITLTKMFKEIATGATFAEYKIVTLKEIPVFVPDMPTQRRYCEQAEQIDKLRFKYQRQIELLNELMEKKMEEYFGGEENA